LAVLERGDADVGQREHGLRSLRLRRPVEELAPNALEPDGQLGRVQVQVVPHEPEHLAPA
jgi:hypothetical protein